MTMLLMRGVISGVLIVLISEIAKRSPAFGGLVSSLPLVSLLAVIWLWHDTGDRERIATHMEATVYYVLPSLPMFFIVPQLLRRGLPFAAALGAGCLITFVLYLMMTLIGSKIGLKY